MKRFLCAVALLMTGGLLSATTTVSGNIKTLGTTATGNSFVRFRLRGCGGNQPRITGIAIVPANANGDFYFDIPANSAGVVSGSLYSTRDAAGTGNGEIECGGSYTAAWYGMQVYRNSVPGPEVPVHAKSGATLDPSNVTPLTVKSVVTSPTGDTTYARIDGGNQPFLGSVTPSGNGVLNLGSSANRWNLFANTISASGAATVGGGITVTGAAAISGGITGSLTGNVTGNVTGILTSSSANPSTSGAIRLASTDWLCFHNRTNSANNCLSQDPADDSWNMPKPLSLVMSSAPTSVESTHTWLWLDSADLMVHYKNASNGGDQHAPIVQALTGSAYTNATTTFSTVGSWTWVVGANRVYSLQCAIYFQGSDSTAGPKFQAIGPGSPTFFILGVDGYTNTTAVANSVVTSLSSANTALGTLGATGTDFVAHLSGTLANGANAGTISIQAAANGTGTLTIQPGSFCQLQ